MGYIVIKKLDNGEKRLVLTNTFDSILLIDYRARQVRSVDVDSLLEFVLKNGKVSPFRGRDVVERKRA